MLAFHSFNEKRPGSAANVLPCRIHQNGPAKVTKRFWAPTRENDNTTTSYFRGRKLRGKTLKLPPGYTGIAAKATEQLLPQTQQSSRKTTAFNDLASDNEDDEAEEKPEPVQLLQTTATFNEITIWGHDILPAAEDPFVKGIEEWISFAETIHGTSGQADTRSASTLDQAMKS